MPWTKIATLFGNQQTAARSVTVDQGYLPGRQVSIYTTGFTGTMDLQISIDGGLTWANVPYTNASGILLTATLSYTNDTSQHYFNVWSANPLFSLSLTSASAGSITANYFAGDTNNLLPNPL